MISGCVTTGIMMLKMQVWSQVGLCDMTIYIGWTKKKSIVSYYVLSFISWCRKIHCLRYFFIIWMTAIFTCHHGTWRGDRTRWRTTRTKRGTTSVAWAHVFNHCSFKTTDFKLLKRKQQSYVCRLCFCVRGPCFFFCRFIGFERLHKHTYASESPSLQVSS